VIGVFEYINHPEVLPLIQQIRRDLAWATWNVGQLIPEFANLHPVQQEFDFDWYQNAALRARGWINARVEEIQIALDSGAHGSGPPNRDSIITQLEAIRSQADTIRPPPKDPAQETADPITYPDDDDVD
jgi:hypothetical protein